MIQHEYVATLTGPSNSNAEHPEVTASMKKPLVPTAITKASDIF